MPQEIFEDVDLLADDAPENPENDEALKDFTGFTREVILSASDPRSACCRASLACGISIFAKSRKNPFSERAEELCQRLSRVRAKKSGVMAFGSAPKGFRLVSSDGDNTAASVSASMRRLDASGGVCAECLPSLLKGCFISAGRLSNPMKAISLEYSMPNQEVAAQMTALLSEKGLPPKTAVRKNEVLLYYKKTETICDVLNYMGAFNSYFKFQDVIIYKEFIGNTNRRTNCDTSNINKTVSASTRQINAITAIMEAGMLDALPRSIRETARIRLENPEVTLEELISLHPSPITRAGIHHRLQKAVAFAEQKGYI